MKRASKAARRQSTRQHCREILEQMVAGEIETYIGYRSLYALWCGNNAAVQELRPMFRIANIEPDGVLSVTEEFKVQVISTARDVLASFSE